MSTEQPPAAGEAIRQLNGLLRREMSAAETYRQVMDRLGRSSAPGRAEDVDWLRGMQLEHGRAAELLRDRIESLGGEPPDTPGAAGLWAQGVQATYNLFGDAAALQGLKESEEAGLKEYQAALAQLDPATAALVHSQILPKQQRHLDSLEQLIVKAGGKRQ